MQPFSEYSRNSVPISEKSGIICIIRTRKEDQGGEDKHFLSIVPKGTRVLKSIAVELYSLLNTIDSCREMNTFTEFLRQHSGDAPIVCFFLVEHRRIEFHRWALKASVGHDGKTCYFFSGYAEMESIFHYLFESEVRVPPRRDLLRRVDFDKCNDKFVFVVTWKNSSSFNSRNSRIRRHYGVGCLISTLKNRGIAVELVNLTGEPPLEACWKILATSPRAVGFSSVTCEFSYIAKITDTLSELAPELPLVGGGPHFSLCPQDILATSLDVVCVGEGELILTEILSGKDVANIAGVVHRDKLGWVHNAQNRNFLPSEHIPTPDYSLWDDELDDSDKQSIPVVISRGCPFRCHYCANRSLSRVSSGPYIRFRTLNHISNEIIHLAESYPGVKKIFLESECMLPNEVRHARILDAIRPFKDRIIFGTNLRIGTFDKRFLMELKEAGISYINFGLESGSEWIRRNILGRHYKNSDVRKAASWLHEVGIEFSTYNMIGLPGEDTNHFKKTIELNREISPHNCCISVYYPYPGTALYYQCLVDGYLGSPFFHQTYDGVERYDTVLSLPGFPRKVILECYNEFRSSLFERY